jgi:hypothetical protein
MALKFNFETERDDGRIKRKWLYIGKLSSGGDDIHDARTRTNFLDTPVKEKYIMIKIINVASNNKFRLCLIIYFKWLFIT